MATPTLGNNDYVCGREVFYFRASRNSQRQIKVAGDKSWYTVSFGSFGNLLDVLHEIDEDLHTVEIIRDDLRYRARDETGIAVFVAVCGMC